MLNLANVFELKPNERVHRVWRRHASTLWWQLFLAAAFIVVPFFFLFLLTKWQGVGIVLFALLEGIGLFLAVRAFLRWDSTVLVLTTHRVCQVIQGGLWKREVVDTPLAFVKGVSWERRGLLERLFGIGTLKIVTGSDQAVVAPSLVQPEKAQALLNELRGQRAWQVDVGEEADQVAVISELLEQADPETMRAVEALLRGRTGL